MANKRIDQLLPANTIVDADLFIVEQLGATTERTRKATGTQLKTYTGASAALTAAQTAQAAADAAQATADLAIPLTQKAAANGVATLDASGKVPASQLTLVSTAFKGNWNATTNSPALSDASGTGGDFYFVQSGASRNLGSGSVAWTTGALIIHNGSIWVENEAVNNIISVAGRTGAITLTGADITNSTDKNLISDALLAALNAMVGTPSASNKVVSNQQLTTALANVTVSGNPFNIVAQSEDGTNSSGTGVNQTLASLGYTNTSWKEQWPLVAALSDWSSLGASAINYDDVVVCDALQKMKANGIPYLYFTGREYNFLLPSTLRIPKSLDGYTSSSNPFAIYLNGNHAVLRMRGTGTGKTFFTREPDDETESQSMVSYRVEIENFTFQGDSTTIKGIRSCSSRKPRYKGLFFRNTGTPIEARFNLAGKMDGIDLYNCSPILCTDGDWTDAATSTSVTQMSILNSCFYIKSASTAMQFIKCDSVNVRDCTFDGAASVASAIYIENAATVCKMAKVEGCQHAENTYTDAFLDVKASDIGSVTLSGVFPQKGNAQSSFGYMVRLNNNSGTNVIRMENMPFNNSPNDWMLRNFGAGNGCFSFVDVKLPGNPTTAAQVVSDAGSYAGLWDTSGSYTIPSEARVYIKPRLL